MTGAAGASHAPSEAPPGPTESDRRTGPGTGSTPPLAARVSGSGTSALVHLLSLTTRPEIISFAVGLPDPELFDVDGLKRSFDAALTRPAAGANLQYSASEGLASLRSVLARRLTAEQLPTAPEEILVTTGSQQALTLVALLLFDPGDVVLVEEPTYLSALEPFRMVGTQCVPVASDGHGVLPQALDAALREHRPRAVYLVPTFANPTGRTLPADRRAEVAGLIAGHDTWLIEDDPYSGLRYVGEHLLPISTDIRVAGRSIYLGTFSKIGCPGLRIGWMRVPVGVMPALSGLKQAADMHTSSLDQAAAAIYLETEDVDGHVASMCHTYGPRRDAMVGAFADTFPPGTTWSEPEGGMFVWVRLPEGYDSTQLLVRALEEHVAFVPGAPFYAGEPDPRTLRMCFSTYEPGIIAEGMRRLGRVFADT